MHNPLAEGRNFRLFIVIDDYDLEALRIEGDYPRYSYKTSNERESCAKYYLS